MRFIFILCFSLILGCSAIAQNNLDDINKTRTQHSLNGMIAFSSWTGANIVAGTVGVLTTQGEWQHFFEMNLYFNAINVAIAIPGLLGAVKAKSEGLSFEQTVKEGQKAQTVYLVNGVLDLSYITAGFLLREIGNNQNHDPGLQNRLRGYGTSFIVQGGFLLIFDFIKFGLHAKNNKRLDEHWKKLTVTPYGAYGLGLSLNYNLSNSSTVGHYKSFN